MKAALISILWKTYITGNAWVFRPNYLCLPYNCCTARDEYYVTSEVEWSVMPWILWDPRHLLGNKCAAVTRLTGWRYFYIVREFRNLYKGIISTTSLEVQWLRICLRKSKIPHAAG